MADIRFDVSNLTYKKFLVLDQSSTTFDGSASEVLSLPSGTYTFRHPDIAAEFTFEVTPDGFINFSAAHDGFLSGRGTSTLVVRGFTTSLDARTLSHDLVPLALAVLLARDRTHVLTLLPAKGYAFLPSSQFVGDFRFDVTTEGTVNYDQGYDGFASGRGSSQLVVGGFPITIDGTGLSQISSRFYFGVTRRFSPGTALISSPCCPPKATPSCRPRSLSGISASTQPICKCFVNILIEA
jgi:hypothetical protein